MGLTLEYVPTVPTNIYGQHSRVQEMHKQVSIVQSMVSVLDISYQTHPSFVTFLHV